MPAGPLPDRTPTLAESPDGAATTPLESAPAPAGAERRATWRTPGRLAAALAVVVGVIAVVMMTRSPAKYWTEQDTVLLAFENKTSDVVFDEAVPLAMAIQLEQSPYLRLLSPGRIQETLRMMRRPADTPVTRAVGMEIGERVGGHAVIVASIASLGRQYVIGLEAVECRTGRVLARRQATTERKEQVLGALQRAASEIRLAVGESPASLATHSLPLVEGTTASLEALRTVRRGDLAITQGQMELALALYRDAVALDADFALAHSRLGSVAFGRERLAALEKAYALRQQVTFPERLEIEAAYHRRVTGEVQRVVDALELLRQSYPRRAMARRDLAVEYMNSGRYDAALTESSEALRLEPDSALNLAVVSRAHLYLNQIGEARQASERSIALGGTAAEPHVLLFWCAVGANDTTLLARERAWAAEHPESAPDWLEDQAEESMNRGRLEEAIAFMKEFEAWATANKVVDWPVRIRFRMARYEALCGLKSQAMRRVEAELRESLGPVAKMDAVRVMVSAGRFDAAAHLLDEMDRDGQPGASQPGATLARSYRAAIAASHGQAAQALDLLAPLRPFELGVAYGFVPLFERAQAHYLAGDWLNARAAFEKILGHPMIDSGRKLLPHAQLGLARTLAHAGDAAGSRRTYEQFFERWSHADRDLPILLQARREYSALPK